MESTLFAFSAIGGVSWTPTRDTIVVGFECLGAGAKVAVLSQDPNVSSTALVAPSANSIDRNLICAAVSGVQRTPVDFPVSAGKAYFVHISAQGSAVIYTEDPLELP